MQVFRLMGMPDKVLAFEELPERFLAGLDMTRADGFPRHWKEWMGKRKRITRIPPERNPLTGEVRTYQPIVEEDHFFYLVDWNIRVQEDRWKEITDYVRLHAPQDMRIPEKLDDMAKPLAKDKLESVSLEPEEVVVIQIPKEAAPLVGSNGIELKSEVVPSGAMYPCEESKDCNAEFPSKPALRMHIMRKHPKVSTPV